MRAGHSIEYGTLAGASGALKSAYYYYGYRHDEDLPELPVQESEDEIQDPEEEFYQKQLRETLDSVLKTLRPREERIIRMRFGFGCREYTLEEIASNLDVTRERIRQIEVHTIRKLRQPHRMTPLEEVAAPSKTAAEKAEEIKAVHRRQVEQTMKILKERKKRIAEYRRFRTKYPSWVDHLKDTNPDLYHRIKAHAALVNKNFFEQYEVQMPS